MQRSYKNQAKNFQKNEKVQVKIFDVWEDYSLLCGSRQVLWVFHRAEKFYGLGNARIVNIKYNPELFKE